MEEKLKKQKKGISLIVLVITIIVMIILATAIIMSLTNSGIIGKANKAKTENDISSTKEIISVAYSEWILMSEEEQTSNGGSFVTYASNKLEKTGIDSEDYIIKETGEVEVCVAKIGEVKYASLNAAIKASPNDEETSILITNNVEEKISVGTRKIVTIDLNGYTISSTGIAIINKGTLTLKDTSSSKSGKINAISDKSLYKPKYDLNNDGVVGQFDIDVITANYNKSSEDEDWDAVKQYDINGDGILDVIDLGYMGHYNNDAYAIFNNGSDAYLLIDNINNGKISGEPIAIYNKDGTVEGYNF